MNQLIRPHASDRLRPLLLEGEGGHDAHAIYVAFKRFHIDNHMYPNASGDPSFQLDTFEPLVSMGYYQRPPSTRLLNGQADGYEVRYSTDPITPEQAAEVFASFDGGGLDLPSSPSPDAALSRATGKPFSQTT